MHNHPTLTMKKGAATPNIKNSDFHATPLQTIIYDLTNGVNLYDYAQ